MAGLSARTLQHLGDEAGHQPGTLRMVLRLLDVLQEIARDRVLADRLVLPQPGDATHTATWSLACGSGPPHIAAIKLGSTLTELQYVL